MDLYDIITAVEPIINKTLVLHRNMKQHPKFKVYKVFEYNLYSIGSDNSKELLLSQSYTINSASEDIEINWDKCDKSYLVILLKWIYNGFNI